MVASMVSNQTFLLNPVLAYANNYTYNCRYIQQHIKRLKTLICRNISSYLQISWVLITALVIIFLLQAVVGYIVCYTKTDSNEMVTDNDLKEAMELMKENKPTDKI